MKESRNFYRILGVQPDADVALIRRAYRTWMQKLRMHPDLGGDGQAAATLNTAYCVLGDASRRAAYDAELLARWNVRELTGPAPCEVSGEFARAYQGNRRNYYRLLGLQPEAPAALIESLYAMLNQDSSLDQRLLEEARHVLGDTDRRATYDAWLRSDGHAMAAAQVDGCKPCIAHYCAYCKTPHCEYPQAGTPQYCYACGSPLNCIDTDTAAGARLFERWSLNHEVTLRVAWPERTESARLRELTPTGLQLSVGLALDSGVTAQIASADVLVVAEVVHCRGTGSDYELGMKLLSAAFVPGASIDIRS